MTLEEKIRSIEIEFSFFHDLLQQLKNVDVVYVDLFCGAGGVTSGIEKSKRARVVFAVNHDPLAIESHHANHGLVPHATEDIRQMDLDILVMIVEVIRELYPNMIICLWASLECTHFSKAKGGESRDADSRTLAEFLYRYVEAINPDYIDIENVVEFMSWGPLRIKAEKIHKDRCDLKVTVRNGKDVDYHWIPESKKNGKYYMRWVQHICNDYGYDYDYRILNAADFGARTSRVRYFGQFKKKDLSFTWPQPTHSKNPIMDGIFTSLKKWKPVKPALDLEDEGKSIFGRKKDLSPNTYKRIYAGLVKYVGEGKEPVFITKYFSGRPAGKVKSINEPSGSITTFGGGAVVVPEFLTKYYGNGGDTAVDQPAGTITTKDRFAVVNAVWLDKQFCSDKNHQSIDRPAGSILTNNKHCKMTTVWVDKFYSGENNHQSVESPLGTILTKDKYALVNLDKSKGWLMNHNYQNTGSDLESPAPTLLASRKHYYLMNPQFDSAGQDVDRPCFTLIARMDKRPPSLIEAETGNAVIVIYDTDIDIIVKIKLFMAAYGIVDIKMRMLKVKELLKIQGFDEDYVLRGNQSDQKRFIGNSVPPELVRAMADSRALKLQSMELKEAV